MLRFTTKEKGIACLLLGVPLALAVFFSFPHYEKFTAPGHIVPISNLGVYGHVYMTYVEEGVTQNYMQKILLRYRYAPIDLDFEPVGAEEVESSVEEIEDAVPYKEAVVANALEVSGYSEESAQTIDAKYERIMKESANYVGDSFGLMVGIGLVEEESHIDFSHGTKYIIAGTGTLEEDGSVGSVGGIKQKLATAEKDRADYFFIPKDKDDFPFDGPSNQEEAEHYAREHALNMQIVPVKTLDEAVTFLKNLP
ncbi:hypothetical protein ACTID9_14365 [Brevibacillus fluminis]|uniref:hypothetical protein n=1 Tax=Brevibacillus fluminis TaxID=511487 RepID=UPI003F897CDF